MMPTAEALRQVILEAVRVHLTRYVSPFIVERLTVDVRRHDDLRAVADMIAADISVDLLTEHLPPQSVTHRVHYEHPEAVGRIGHAADARFATWKDHFTATYRGRWWARLLRIHKREIRYTFVSVPYITTAAVQCDHKVTISILDTWRYPKADTTIRDMHLGEPVLWSEPGPGRAFPLRPETSDLWHN